MTKSEVLLQALLEHRENEMHDLTTCEFELALQGLPKHLSNMVYELQTFEQKRLLATAICEEQDTQRKPERLRQFRTKELNPIKQYVITMRTMTTKCNQMSLLIS